MGQYWPRTHALTVAVVASGQKLPAGHARQVMLEVTLHGPKTNWPGTHTPHGVHDVALPAML